MEEAVEIRSTDPWVKVVGMLQQNWAFLEEVPAGGAVVRFVADDGGVFDEMRFPALRGAIAGLRRNGFRRFQEDTGLQKFLELSEGPFHRSSHMSGAIYSSGAYWDITPGPRLVLLQCDDSTEMAESRRRELDIPREVAAALGRSAVDASNDGFYRDQRGNVVDWRGLVERARLLKKSIAPHDPLLDRPPTGATATRVLVANVTTLQASRRLVEAGLRPLALNFANGVQPGGGFLSGARAQEEVLCRSSALHATLVDDPMYLHHARRPLPDSTDWAIYSPEVPVFRDDDGTALERPWLLDVITSAAPVAYRIGQQNAGDLLNSRIRRVLAIAASHGHQSLVLGAWGCGAFGNDVTRTAADFRGALESEFAGVFSDVVFAITDWSPERKFLGPFRDAFS